MFRNPAVNVDEVMKYSVQYTKQCLGKPDLVILFFPFCHLIKVEDCLLVRTRHFFMPQSFSTVK